MILPTKLYHYSLIPIEKLRDDFWQIDFSKIYGPFKPGYSFWFSVEDFENDQTWKTWCEGEEFRLEGLKYKYLVSIKKEANILLISTRQELIDFSIRFVANDLDYFADFLKKSSRDTYLYIYQIKWQQVQKLWDGIIIAPYQWECRMASETTWYYPWDCASGCVWNMDAIESLTLESIQEEMPEVQEEENGKDLQSAECSQLT